MALLAPFFCPGGRKSDTDDFISVLSRGCFTTSSVVFIGRFSSLSRASLNGFSVCVGEGCLEGGGGEKGRCVNSEESLYSHAVTGGADGE